MTKTSHKSGIEELRAHRRRSRGLYWSVGIFSFFVNMLMLTGPLYMMQVYDRVLGSRSVETLIALSLLVVFLYGTMGVLDYARGRILARVGARFQAGLDQRVFDAMIRRSAVAPDPVAQTGLSDLESVQRLIASPVLGAAFDLPWTPIFLFGIALFHPWLGLLALGGGAVLIAIAVLNQFLSRRPQMQAGMSGHRANLMSEEIRTEAEMIQSMGMRRAAFQRWKAGRDAALVDSVTASDVGGGFTTLTKTLRLFLQSAMLGLGAYLVLQNQVTAGAMIAGSILMGRALAPIELALGQWAMVQRALKGWRNLAELLDKVPEEVERTELPKPTANLEVQALAVVPPGDNRPQLRNVSFRVQPGQAIGVIGPSGSGKSTLARALTGAWRPAAGTVRLDGASLDQYAPEVLGQNIGYLPQRVQLFEGTIAQNIARLSPNPDSAKVVAAAKKAAAHDMIVHLPDGYDTHITAGGGRLSGGQMQRVALARALYDDPVIVILDEPNSNLDNDGSVALNRAIKQLKAEGHSVLIMAHRPAAIQECDLLLVIDQGVQTAFGPKDKVLREMVSNHQSIQQAAPGGVR
ncbi:type I secretion system permease/ATPase [Phaeobacter gallaeciensis]|uniref:Alkaline protease secretion ATP-binding protein AprD n=1 Tax=Phaeobacter gallaeciensis TaxID=60890 RepID=A0AAC9Z6Q5_9RHOB|nr:type I secretion system permease/ATPase [Phaeobacter gallaeciensis]AHD08288.1 type I secretion system ABC transporter, PrtD family [Phaeobacter gallaeciensis DSM 26640]ATE91554.1 alkaline protease secretion ATP-binding protein AprD [Phaeobacter gallaeciensis]ATE95830.1 alkaline protease secretion ATP-binding protein AprD [Phaeobacter gallaeciensis]ATF00170.1 alkaline protease secretion ATP-binding protein AprD [Phaeobacter gallaeciensis]ATF04602.1 alkaline protease secretion ATP-binding pro